MVFCRFCGAENAEDNAFCKKCGKKINDAIYTDAERDLSKTEQEIAPREAITEQSGSDSGEISVRCPKCGKGNCQVVSKANVQVSGGGYNFWNGCCGRILLGPAGYLCGACGSGAKMSVQNETWFVCNQCGTEFMSKQSALNNAVLAMRSAVLYTVFLTIGFLMFRDERGSFGISAICALIVVCIWGGIPISVTQSTGRSMKELFSSEERRSFWLKFIGYLALGLAVGCFFAP